MQQSSTTPTSRLTCSKLDAMRCVILGATIATGNYGQLMKARPTGQWPRAWTSLAEQMARHDPGNAESNRQLVYLVCEQLGIGQPAAGKLVNHLFATWQKLERAASYQQAKEKLEVMKLGARMPEPKDQDAIEQLQSGLREVFDLLEQCKHEKQGKAMASHPAAQALGTSPAGHSQATGSVKTDSVARPRAAAVPDDAGNGAAAGDQRIKRS